MCIMFFIFIVSRGIICCITDLGFSCIIAEKLKVFLDQYSMFSENFNSNVPCQSKKSF